jgi:hypothetical protein
MCSKILSFLIWVSVFRGPSFCEACDRDWGNLLFQHCFPPDNWDFWAQLSFGVRRSMAVAGSLTFISPFKSAAQLLVS